MSMDLLLLLFYILIFYFLYHYTNFKIFMVYYLIILIKYYELSTLNDIEFLKKIIKNFQFLFILVYFKHNNEVLLSFYNNQQFETNLNNKLFFISFK